MKYKAKYIPSQGKSQKISYSAYPSYSFVSNFKHFLSDPSLLYGLLSYLDLITDLAYSNIKEIRFSHQWYADTLSLSVSQIQRIEDLCERWQLIERCSNGKWAPDRTKPLTVKISAVFLVDWVRRQLRGLLNALWLSKKDIFNLNENPDRLVKNVNAPWEKHSNVWGESPSWLTIDWGTFLDSC